MKMGTCEQPQPAEQQGDREAQREGLSMEENNLMISGPPASRTVIDNLKKLLLQRQHSRESDTENNRNIAIRSDQGSNSDAAFYSQFSTSSSDSDDSSDYMIFQEISNQEGCNSNEGRRKHRRRRSYSSSSSSSSSPVARCRRKVTRVNVTLTSSIGGDGEASTPQKSTLDEPGHNNEYNDSANSTSSHKDSSSEDDFPGASNSKSLSSSEDVAPNRCAKLKSRRDRDRKRKRYELNYTSHRPKLLKASDSTTITSPRNEESSQSIPLDNVPANGQDDGCDASKSVIQSSSSKKDTSENPENESVGFSNNENSESSLQQPVNNDAAQTTSTTSPSSSSTTTTINPVSPKTAGE